MSIKRQTFGSPVGWLTFGFTALILTAFLIYPMCATLSRAFLNDQGWTLDHFSMLWNSRIHLTGLMNSLWIGIGVTFVSTVLALPAAIFMTRYQFPGKTLFGGLLLVPMVLPPFVGAIGIQRFFALYGSLNIFLLENSWIEEPIQWLSPQSRLFAVIILEALHLYPIMYMNLMTTLANLDPSLDECAATLGASRLQRLKDIAWPLSRPGFFAGSSIVFIWALTDLGTPLLAGFHEVAPVQIFTMMTDLQENPIGHALVVTLVAFSVGLFTASKLRQNNQKYQMMGRGHSSSSIINASPLFSFFICCSLLLLVLTALVPHFGILLTSLSDEWFMSALPESYTLRHYQMVMEQELPWAGIQNSLYLSAISTLLDLTLGLLISYAIVHKTIPFTRILDALIMLPLALPGIVLAFGYVSTYTHTWLDPMQNPVPLLVIAYAIRRLPFMVRSCSAGFQQINRSLEEVSWTLGASKLRTLCMINLPLVTANLIAGGLLCFAYAMLDVSDSLILAMKEDSWPLTKAIYAICLEPGGGDTIASALGVIGMSILACCILGASVLLGQRMGDLFRH
ncbi:MAG: ABC transporter permease [Oligoflexales bacterium]